jgi:rubrerythrin
MKIFEEMMEFLIEEADDAEKYAKLAIKLKREHPELAKMFEELSADEYKHMNTFVTHMSKLAEQREMLNIPADVVTVYHYLKNGMINEKAMMVKHLHSMYSGN